MESFWDYIRSADLRFYQERDLGLDLYHAGWLGPLLAALVVAAAVVFILAIFHVIPSRRHVAGLLLGLGLLAGSSGLAASYFNYRDLGTREKQVVRDEAGPRPADERQRAAVIALPLLLGTGTLAASCLGCLYLAAFWGTSLIGKGNEAEKPRS